MYLISKFAVFEEPQFVLLLQVVSINVTEVHLKIKLILKYNHDMNIE